MSRWPLRCAVLSLLVVTPSGCSDLIGDFTTASHEEGGGSPLLDEGGLDADGKDAAPIADAAHIDADGKDAAPIADAAHIDATTRTGVDAAPSDAAADSYAEADAGAAGDVGPDRAGEDADAHLDGPASDAANADVGAPDADATVAPPTCATGGSCAPVQVTALTGTSTILSLAVAGPYLYVLESDSNQSLVYRVPTTGGTLELLSYPAPAADSNGNPLHAITADVSYIYGFPGGTSGISRLPILGGNFADFASSSGIEEVSALRANGSYLVFAASLSSNYLESVSKSAGGAATRIVTSLTISGTFAIDDAFIYVGQQSGTSISRVPIAGGGATPVATPDPGEAFDLLEVSGDQLVFTSNARVGKVLAAGGTASTLDPGTAFALVTDATRAFFFRASASADGGPPCASGADLYAVPVGGGTREHAASEPMKGGGACPFAVVADATAVYWVAGDGQTIEKMLTAGL